MASSSIPYAGRAFLYVLRLAGPEDLLKVGISRDPLARWSAFHPRWFEAFDLEHSLLVETEARRDAQSLETQWHRAFAEHRCPVPMTMREAAGGGTEWYRGAGPAAMHLANDLESQGYVVHRSATPWLAAAMRGRQDALPGLIQQAQSDDAIGALSPAQRQALQDLLDAHRAFDPEVASNWPEPWLDGLRIRR